MSKTDLDLARMCKEAYQVGHEDVYSIRDIEALVQEHNDCITIAFRGTEVSPFSEVTNLFDTLRNFRFWKYRTVTGADAHKGFARAAEHWAFAFYTNLRQIGKPLVITGHSQGAAVAVQSVPVFISKGFDVLRCAVFAEPASWRSGDEEMYQEYEVPSVSYLNENDWIRFAPPWGSTGVPRTYLNKKKGISKKAHSMDNYVKAMEDYAVKSEE